MKIGNDYCGVCHKKIMPEEAAFCYLPKKIFIHNKCKKEWKKILNDLKTCNWCHPTPIHKCSLCKKKIGLETGSGAFVAQPHQFHEYCSSKCQNVMWNFLTQKKEIKND